MSNVWHWLLASHRGEAATGLASPRTIAAEALAGIAASIITIAHCLSYSALIFSGDLRDGLPLGLWGFLIGTTIGCLVTAALTSIPPGLAGPRNPVVAVMSVLATTVAAEAAAQGLGPAAAIGHVLIALAIATLLTALAMGLLGALELGQVVRFIPHPVIAGFLVASGWLLIAGGIKVAVGRPLPGPAQWLMAPEELARVALAIAFAGTVVYARFRGVRSTFLPALFVSGALFLDLLFAWLGRGAGWFLSVGSMASPWTPISLLNGPLDWRVISVAHVEILSIAGVAAIALLLDASTLEAQRRANANMDREFKVGGIANAAVVPFGGFAVALAPNATRMIDEMGGRTRLSGLFGASIIGVTLFSGLNLASYVPTPLLAGLLVYLGYSVIADALWKAPARGTRAELVLTLAIAVSIVQFGYLTGIILGLVGACVLFAARYSRIDAVHRHLTRAEFSSPAERDSEATAILRREGPRIHLFWLKGFIFFGSSNRIYEMIRDTVSATSGTPGRWVILDLARVSGIDSSALLSFMKLSNWAKASGVTLAIASASPALTAELQRASSDGRIPATPSFKTRGEALEWCEDQLLAGYAAPSRENSEAAFRQWLAAELGEPASHRLISQHLVRRDLAAGEHLCRQGEASRSIELIASGSVAIVLADAAGRHVRLRRMTHRTVVGEMGFFRGLPRGASIVAEATTSAYVLDRDSYEAMTRTDPELAKALLEFVVRALANRVEFTNTEIAALV